MGPALMPFHLHLYHVNGGGRMVEAEWCTPWCKCRPNSATWCTPSRPLYTGGDRLGWFLQSSVENSEYPIFNLNDVINQRPHFLVDGKFLTKLGDGGCRGHDWDKKGCPKFLGRKTKNECARECRKSEFW